MTLNIPDICLGEPDGENVRISIRSTQYNVDGMGGELFFDEDGTPFVPRTGNEAPSGPSTIELDTEGRMTCTEGRLEISYDETELTGMAGSTTCISFDMSDPGLVTMIREGSVRTVLIFEEGRRHICAYETEYLPFELCLHSYRVENSVTAEGGSISLDYVIEVRGADAERTRFSLEVRKI